MPKAAGGRLTLQPGVFHRVMEQAPVAEWQVVQDGRALATLAADPG